MNYFPPCNLSTLWNSQTVSGRLPEANVTLLDSNGSEGCPPTLVKKKNEKKNMSNHNGHRRLFLLSSYFIPFKKTGYSYSQLDMVHIDPLLE